MLPHRGLTERQPSNPGRSGGPFRRLLLHQVVDRQHGDEHRHPVASDHVCRRRVPGFSPVGQSIWGVGWCRSPSSSTFLRPFAPPALPGFDATMDALTPVRRLFLPVGSHGGIRHMNTVLPGTGLSVSRIWSSEHPVPNHPSVPGVAFAHNPSAHRASPPCSVPGHRETHSGVRASPFPSRLADRTGRNGFDNYGLLVHLLLLSTPPRGDAVTFGYRPECVCLKRTCTSLTKNAYRRTRERPQWRSASVAGGRHRS